MNRPSSASDALARLERDWPPAGSLESDDGHAEAAMERLLVQGRHEQVLENAAIARESGGSSARIEWLAAKSMHALGRTRDAYRAFRDAVSMNPVPRLAFAIDFAKLLREISRFEEAAQELAPVIDEHSEPDVHQLYVELLHDCQRLPEAAAWAVDHRVIPAAAVVAREASLLAMNRGQSDFAIACAAVADPEGIQTGDLAAAAGLGRPWK